MGGSEAGEGDEGPLNFLMLTDFVVKKLFYRQERQERSLKNSAIGQASAGSLVRTSDTLRL